MEPFIQSLGEGAEASRCCEFRLVELEMPGDSTCLLERTVNASAFLWRLGPEDHKARDWVLG